MGDQRVGDQYTDCHKNLMDLSWRVIKKSRCHLADLGFAWNQYSVMKRLEPGKPLTVSEISSKVNRNKSNVTPIIDFLVSKDIVERIPDDRDRRIIRVKLTEKGIETRAQVMAEHNSFIRNLYKKLDEDEMKAFLEITNIFIEKVK